jgi:hypothetical protein
VLQFGLCVAPKGGLQWNVESKVQPPGYNSVSRPAQREGDDADRQADGQTFSAEKYTQVILDTLKRHDVIDRVIFQCVTLSTLSRSLF